MDSPPPSIVTSTDLSDSHDERVETESRCHLFFIHLGQNILYHEYYGLVYLSLFLLQLILFIYALVSHYAFSHSQFGSTWYLVIDCIITFFYLLELTLRILSSNPISSYFKSIFNLIDLSLLLICIILLFGGAYLESDEEVVASALEAVRYFFLFGRLIWMDRKRKRVRLTMNEEKVDFSALDLGSGDGSGNGGTDGVSVVGQGGGIDLGAPDSEL